MRGINRSAGRALLSSFQVLIATGIAGVLAYATQAIIARSLGPEEYGLAGTLLATYSFVFFLLTPGTVTITGLVAAARGRNEQAGLTGAIRATVIVGIAAAIAVIIAGLVGQMALDQVWHIADPSVTWWFIVLLATGILVACTQAVLRGLQSLHALSTSIAVDPIFRLVVVIIPGALLWGGTHTALGSFLAGALAALAIGLFSCWKWLWIPGRRPRRDEVVGVSIGAVLLALTFGLAHHAPLALARATLSSVETGYFAAIVTLTMTLLVISEPIGSVLYPMVTAEAHRGGDTRPILFASAAVMLVAIGGGAGLLWLFAGPVVTFTFGPDYAPAAPLLGSYAGSRALWVVVVFLASYALAHGRLWTVSLATLAAIVQTFLLVMWGGTADGIANAGWAGALLGVVMLSLASLRDESRMRAAPADVSTSLATGD